MFALWGADRRDNLYQGCIVSRALYILLLIKFDLFPYSIFVFTFSTQNMNNSSLCCSIFVVDNNKGKVFKIRKNIKQSMYLFQYLIILLIFYSSFAWIDFFCNTYMIEFQDVWSQKLNSTDTENGIVIHQIAVLWRE